MRQWRRYGVFGFLRRYLGATCCGGCGARATSGPTCASLEIEADWLARRMLATVPPPRTASTTRTAGVASAAFPRSPSGAAALLPRMGSALDELLQPPPPGSLPGAAARLLRPEPPTRRLAIGVRTHRCSAAAGGWWLLRPARGADRAGCRWRRRHTVPEPVVATTRRPSRSSCRPPGPCATGRVPAGRRGPVVDLVDAAGGAGRRGPAGAEHSPALADGQRVRCLPGRGATAQRARQRIDWRRQTARWRAPARST